MNWPTDYINKVLQGDCLEVMKQLPENSIDSIVTDPPYGLSFMGKHWDYDVPTVDVWRECLRVLKPGGHLLSFAGTRTYHRMAVNIEDAGFEIRDMIAWIYGSGFPKSLNIGKAVDKLQGDEREVVGDNPNFRPVSGKKGYLGESNFRQTDGMGISTKGTSTWEGWGTALKPALEPICVARKPLAEKTVAANVLQYGTGGINVDGCRLEVPGRKTGTVNPEAQNGSGNCYRGSDGKKQMEYDLQNKGRFPANLIHDGSEEVMEGFPDSGNGSGSREGIVGGHKFGGEKGENATLIGYWPGGSGSAARFFYCAKASKEDRDEGCEELEKKEQPSTYGDMGAIDGNPRKVDTGHIQRIRNFHPCVKPTDLMRYLCRLVTPPNGIILDPFGGSGSTGKGAKLEEFNCIIIEREAEYCEIARNRIDGTLVNKKLNFTEAT